MCLSVPVKILEIKNDKAIVDSGSTQNELDVSLVPDIKEGDYCLISNGFVVKKISQQDAEEIFKIIYPAKGEVNPKREGYDENNKRCSTID